MRKSDRESAGAAIESIHTEVQSHKGITSRRQICQKGPLRIQVRDEADLRGRGRMRENLCTHTQNMWVGGCSGKTGWRGKGWSPDGCLSKCPGWGGMRSDGCEMVLSLCDPGP